MKVRMLKSMVGPDVNLRPKDIEDFSSAEAKRLIEAGIAEPVKETKKKAVGKASERAVIE